MAKKKFNIADLSPEFRGKLRKRLQNMLQDLDNIKEKPGRKKMASEEDCACSCDCDPDDPITAKASFALGKNFAGL